MKKLLFLGVLGASAYLLVDHGPEQVIGNANGILELFSDYRKVG